MTRGTAEALKLEPSHRLYLIKSGEVYEPTASPHIWFYAKPTAHDAAEPVYFSLNRNAERIRYIVDTGVVPLFDVPPHYLLIECNHVAADLLSTDIDDRQKQRILNNHLSIERLAKYLAHNSLHSLQEIHLLHISKRHGNAEQFRQIVQNIVGEGVKVFAY